MFWSNKDKVLAGVDEVPEALLFFLPCYGDRGKNYGNFFDRFSERIGYTTFTLDEAVSPQQEKQSMAQFIDFVGHVDKLYTDTGLTLPKYLIGHSLGGLQALRLS